MKIAIIDYNEFYRNYLRMILPLLEGVTEVHDLPYNSDVIEGLKRLQPDVLIFDPCLDNQVDLGLFGKAKAELPSCNLIAYLEPDDEQHGETLYRMGVANVLSKSSGTEYLRYILRQLLSQMDTNISADSDALAKMAKAGEKIELVHKGMKPLRAPAEGPIKDVPDDIIEEANSTTELEPSEREANSLTGLRMRLLRKKDAGEDNAEKKIVASSFQKIWAERKRVGTSSGSKNNLRK